MTLWILVAATAALAVIAWRQAGPPLVLSGLSEGWSLLLSVLPQLVAGFLLAGFITVLMPAGAISQWVGEDSGLPGLLIATVAGALTPGGPFVQFPLVATLARAGAGPGPMVAYLTAWSLLGLQRLLVWEIPVLGPQFALARWLISLPVGIVAGLLVPPILRLLTGR